MSQSKSKSKPKPKSKSKSASKSVLSKSSSRKYFENNTNFDDIHYEICLIDQIDALANATAEKQKDKCRIRYARVFYLLKALKENETKFSETEKENMGWPPSDLIELAEQLSENTVKSNKKLCESIDIKYEKEKNQKSKKKAQK